MRRETSPPVGSFGLTRPEELAARLRLVVITDRGLAHGRPVMEVVEAALRGGCRAVQLRDKNAPARELLVQARALLQVTRDHGALLFINDRADVALAAGADGVHLGPDDIPVAAVREWVGDRLLIGYSTDDPDRARRARADGADYIGCGAVFGTRTKDVGGEAIGPERLDALARSVEIPVVGIGGITVANVGEVAATAAAGAAVVGSVMGAPDPEAVVRALLGLLERG